MRGSQVFTSLVIIALLAMGLVYLEAHGYFHDQRIAAMSALTLDANAPKPEPPEADEAGLSAPSNSPNGMTGDLGTHAMAASSPASATNAPQPANVAYSAAPMATDSSAATNNPQNATPSAAATNVTQPQANASQAVSKPNSVVTTTPPVASTTTAAPMPANAETTRVVYKIVYVDADGNACRARRVAVREKIRTHREPGTYTTTRVHRAPRRLVDNTAWIYGTAAAQPAPQPRRAYGASTACGMVHQTANGERVVNLPAGMPLSVALDRDLSTLSSVAGEEFGGYLIGPITYCGEVIVPAGALVEGTVVHARRRDVLGDDDAALQLRLSTLAANGFNVAVSAFSSNRRFPDEVPYRTVQTMNDPNYLETTRENPRDITLPAHSVVSFSLHTGAQINF